jgi:hypothetical protein
VRLLIKSKADVNERSYRSPMYYARNKEHTAIVRLLVAAKAQV